MPTVASAWSPLGDMRMSEAGGADGVAYVLNVTAGDVVVMASAGGHALRQHTVNARADVVTLTATGIETHRPAIRQHAQ
mgnify:CR=1 FL=1